MQSKFSQKILNTSRLLSQSASHQLPIMLVPLLDHLFIQFLGYFLGQLLGHPYFASIFATSLLLCWGQWYRARAKKQVGGAARWTCREDQKLTEEMVDGREGDRWALILFYCACFLMKEFYNINLKNCGVSGACAFMVINCVCVFAGDTSFLMALE